MKNYSIKEASEILQVPKSTLRYWEQEGLLKCNHNYDNDYREYTTDDLVQLSDIAFYRSLNFPVKSLHNLYTLSYPDYLELLQNSYQEVDAKIIELIRTKEKIGKRMDAITTFQELAIGNVVHKKPFFNQIEHMNFRERKNVIPYLNDQNILAIVFNENDKQVETRGIISDKVELDENTLWNHNEQYSYVPCLIKITDRNINDPSLAEMINDLKKQGKKINRILGNYLITDKNSDYYQGWIEII